MSVPDFLQCLNEPGFRFFRFSLSFLWQSSVLLGGVWGVSRLFRHWNAGILHMLWIAAFSLLPFLPPVSWMAASLGTPAIPLRVMPSDDAYREEMTRLWTRHLASLGLVESQGEMGNSVASASASEAARAVSHSGWGEGSVSTPVSPWAWVMCVYLGVVFLFLACIAAGWFRLRHWVEHGVAVTGSRVLEVFRGAALRLGVRRDYTVLASPDVSAPVTVGVFHPIILLPPDLAVPQALPDLQVIALHELAHIRRRDPLTFLFVSLVRAVFFFHPFLWTTSRKISLLAERACDDAVLAITGQPLLYAKTLARMAERVSSRRIPLTAAAGLFLFRSIFLLRIESILSEKRAPLPAASRWTVAGILASCLIAFTLACSVPLGERKITVTFEKPRAEVAGFSHHAVAFAAPLEGITVDGRVDDWPEDLVRYPIRNHEQAYGPSDIDSTDLDTSTDLSPEMMVGYSPGMNLLYLAVIVRDDSVYVERNPHNRNCFMSDACEVYVDGAHVLKRVPVSPGGILPVRQYVMCPEGGAYSNFIDAADPLANPNLTNGDISRTRTKGACVRGGGVTTYEWAVELYDRYPDRVTQLRAGKTVGLDVAVVDRDNANAPVNNPAGGNSAWVCWAQYGILKAFDTDLLGNLVLVGNQDRLGMIRGRVNFGENGAERKGLDIDVFRDGEPAGRIKTGPSGQYAVPVLPGRYTLKPHPGQNIRGFVPDTMDIPAGKPVYAELTAAVR